MKGIAPRTVSRASERAGRAPGAGPATAGAKAWGLLALGVLSVLGGAAGCRNEKRDAGPFNLLFVTIDTVRADRIGAYGYAKAETPNLDRLAREGVRFDQAVSTVPLTLPSHATMLSGLLPPRHGLRGNGGGRFPADRATLATLLSGAGYRAAAFLGAFVLDRRFGLNRGFELYDDEIERDPDAPGGLEAERAGPIVTDRALAWLEEAKRGRFFAWVHLYDAHAPYAPPEPYRSRHSSELYDGEIALVDAQIGRLLDFLDRNGLAVSTVVAVAGDHGEALGEHGELTHGLLLYEPTLRVPFVVRAPERLKAGSVVKTPVSLADAAPTLAALVGVPFPRAVASPAGDLATTATTVETDGHDLSAELLASREPPAADVYAESEYARIFGWAGLSALRYRNLKYVSAPGPELYDLGKDPGETSNGLALGTGREDLEKRIAVLRGVAVSAAPAAGANDETMARLASLGYVTGPATVRPPERGRFKDPKDMVGLFRAFEQANWDLNDKRVGKAASALEELVRKDPENPVFRGLLARACRQARNPARAVALYREAVTASPDDPEVRYNLAVTLQEMGRPAEALAALAEAIRRDPGRPEAHNALGIALAATGKPVEAIAEFDRAAELDPRDARPLNNRGNVLRQMGRPEEAEKAFRAALERSPRYAEAWNGLGVLEVARDRPAAALPLFERALAADPAFFEARLNRAIAFETLGNRPDAAAAYREFLRLSEGRPELSQQRGIARQLLARIEKKAPPGR